MNKNKPIIAPMLTSTETMFSNFWTNFHTAQEYELNYLSIYNRKKNGCFKCFGVNDCYMMDLRDDLVRTILGNKEYENKYEDDVEISALARKTGLVLHVCNKETYGYIPDFIEYNGEANNQAESFVQLKIQHLLNGPNKTFNEPLAVTKYIKEFYDSNVAKSKKRGTRLGFDQIYVINLERRPNRRSRIQSTLNELNLSFKIFNAVDGKNIEQIEKYVNEFEIKSIPNYRDPYNDRPLNYGEIGCFLSHYLIWKEVS
jgi:collagen beta-1,O-galactosyltransferase